MSERLTRTTLRLLRHYPPSCLASLLSFSPPPPGTSECAPVHRCIASTPLHYDSYIAIFIISAVHRCPQSRLTSVVSSSRLFPPFLLSSLARRASSLFWQITAGEFKASRGANPRAAPRQDRSMENSLEEIPPGVRSVVTRIVED